MENYRDLLLKPEWKSKRKIILKRDENRCVNCDNFHLVKHLEVGIFENWEGQFTILEEKKGISIQVAKIEGPILNNGILVRLFDKVNFVSTENYSVYYEKSLGDKMHIRPVVGIVNSPLLKGKNLLYCKFFGRNANPLLKKNNFEHFEWIYVTGLHIHHTYYQEGLLPWEYPDSSLQTLCWHCHEELHKNEKVPVLNEQGIEYRKLTPCVRCCGLGYLPHYHYVQNGICFRCNGARFEEMINRDI